MKKIILLCAALLTLGGCVSSEAVPAEQEAASSDTVVTVTEDQPAATTVFAMDTVMELTAYGGDDALMEKAASRIQELDELLSTTNPDSEIYAINRDGSGSVSEDAAALVRAGIQYGAMTGGLLDVTIYPIVKEWGFTTGDYQVPDASVIASLLEKVDYRRIQFDEETNTVTLPEGMMIDFGSLAKGYTGDVLLKLFADSGITSAMVNLGGNVQTLGTKPDGSQWRIAIQDPQSSDYLGIVSVANQAVITSGGYERYFQDDDGTVYWHIFHPETGYPAKSGLISVTIIADNGLYAESLSTSLFVMGAEDAAEFWRQHRDFEAVLIAEDGSISITEGLSNCFTLADEYQDRGLTVIPS